MPQPGDSVVGTVESIESRDTRYASGVPVLTVSDEATGERIDVWALHTVLVGELKKKKPKIGERIAIKRLADAAPPAKYARYSVILDRTEPEKFSWDAVSGQGSDVDSRAIAAEPRTQPNDVKDTRARLTADDDKSDKVPF
jgi:hypothetical protein